MEPKKFRNKHGPEYKIQKDFVEFLKDRGWLVERMIGNALQFGIPDIYIMHPEHGDRWVDLKAPGKYEFTSAQRVKWPLWATYNVGVWIITAATEEEYDKLFGPPNFMDYWKEKYNLENLDDLLRELYEDDDIS